MLSSVTFPIVSISASDLNIVKLQDKPDWAGTPGGPNGGGGDNGDKSETYVLNIEIDYMTEHTPTQEVLNYIVNYYADQKITVTFYVDDTEGFSDIVTDPTPLDGITDNDFWAIEALYNDNDNGYDDTWKWVFFGTTVEGESNTLGYTYVVVKGINLVAGNYIFIADEATDSWAPTTELEVGAEATVLMHEMGHSIGIGVLGSYKGTVYEIYDPDTSSVMSYLSEDNAGLYGAWYYSDDYWATRNMKYYKG